MQSKKAAVHLETRRMATVSDKETQSNHTTCLVSFNVGSFVCKKQVNDSTLTGQCHTINFLNH